MNLWLRRLIGPGPTRDAGPTQPLDDTPAAADTLGWLPSDALADALEQANRIGLWNDGQIPVVRLKPDASRWANHWSRVVEYSVIFVVGFALGALVAS